MAFQYGATVFPVAAGTAVTLLPSCDPSLAKLIDYTAFMIRRYLDDAVVDVADLKKTDNQAIPIESAIEMVAPVNPDTIARAEQFQFPLWCMWRKSAVYSERTGNWIQDVSMVGAAYIFPPLSAIQSIRLTSALTSVSQIVNYAINTGHDPAYNSDERIVRDNNISKVRLLSADFGHFDFAGKQTPPYFPAWVGEIELTEQQTPYVVGLTNLTGSDVTVTHQAKDSASTIITANAAIGATSIQLASSAGFIAGNTVEIGHGTARAEFAIVNSVPNATHIVIAAPGLVFAHTAAQADAVTESPVTIVSAKTEVG